MTDKELITILDGIHNTYKDKPMPKSQMMKIVELGMKYREEQFINGFDILVKTLHGENK